MTGQNQPEPVQDSQSSDFSASVDWLKSLAALGNAVLRLAVAELSLAREDLGRMIVVGLLILPVILLSWIATSALVAWIVYETSASVTLGISSFAAIQLAVLCVLLAKLRSYRRSLSLPTTRAHIAAIIGGIHETSQSPDPDKRT